MQYQTMFLAEIADSRLFVCLSLFLLPADLPTFVCPGFGLHTGGIFILQAPGTQSGCLVSSIVCHLLKPKRVAFKGQNKALLNILLGSDDLHRNWRIISYSRSELHQVT